MSDETVVLLNCPFCEAQPHLIRLGNGQGFDYSYHCPTPECHATNGKFDTHEKAIAAWNRRATPSPVGASVLWSDERMNERATYFANEVDGNAGTYHLFMVALTEMRDDYEAHRGASVPSLAIIIDELERLCLTRIDEINNDNNLHTIMYRACLAWLAQAHRGASVPSEVMETIKESVNYAKKLVNELGKRSLTQREIDFAIARFDAALTWLAQQRGQG